MRAFKLYIGSDNASHLLEGEVALDKPTDVASLHFQESPPGSALAWHVAPQRQYVLTLTGTLEFTTRDDEVFIIRPGDVGEDHVHPRVGQNLLDGSQDGNAQGRILTHVKQCDAAATQRAGGGQTHVARGRARATPDGGGFGLTQQRHRLSDGFGLGGGYAGWLVNYPPRGRVRESGDLSNFGYRHS